jgi:predicted NBD/HSP70 family sugar kinase
MHEKNDSYRKKIIKQLYFAHTLSCADLSLRIKKSLPLTTKILNGLIDNNLVFETGTAPSTGGRRANMYSLKPGVFYIVSVAIDQFVTRIAIMDMQNNFVTPIEKFELPLVNNPGALTQLATQIDKQIKKSKIKKQNFIGIGIGMPGFVDVKEGINHTFLKSRGKSITETIKEKTGLPVFIDNDSSVIALAELRFGKARKRRNVMVINIGWGVGLGLILNGELFRGNNGFAGEFSHIPIFSNGKLCGCGKSGCLETETSLLVILQKAKEELKTGRVSRLKLEAMANIEEGSEELIAAVHKGDRFAIELFSEAGYNIGRGIAILIHLLNPELVILSGRGASAGRIWEAPMQQALNEHCIPQLAANTTLDISTLGYNAELIGSAALVMENYDKEHADHKSVVKSRSRVLSDNINVKQKAAFNTLS